jgi:hypothetical protein
MYRNILVEATGRTKKIACSRIPRGSTTIRIDLAAVSGDEIN